MGEISMSSSVLLILVSAVLLLAFVLIYKKLSKKPEVDTVDEQRTDTERSISALVYIKNLTDLVITFGDSIVDEVVKSVIEKIRKEYPDLEIDYIGNGYLEIANFESEDVAKRTLQSIVLLLDDSTIKVGGIDVILKVYAGIGKAPNSREKAFVAIKQGCSALRNLCDYDLVRESHREDIADIVKEFNILKKAILDDRIVPVFQPIVRNSTRAVEKFEVLARVQTQAGKKVSIYAFRRLLSDAHLYTEITTLIFHKAIEVMRSVKAYEFSLNLQASDIHNRHLIEFIGDRVQGDKDIAHRIVLEVLETEGIKDHDAFEDFIKTMKSYGVKIAIDDFGTGFSNFENLILIEPHFVKIDGSLIKNLFEKRLALAIVRSVSLFCRDMGIETVAEFVENEKLFNAVKKLGITYSQGYYFSKPISAEELIEKYGLE